ncbi:MAG TPA: DNA polymerase Y family protein [Steroidobacteraceae bacterium]|nr:DNA polymerase Y family protein [Steroidobacteraceae bacterium]
MHPPLIRIDGATAPSEARRTLERAGAATSLRALPAAPVLTEHPELWAGLYLRDAQPSTLEQLAAVCAGRFTPRVSLAAPDGLLLEVKGSLHLFAGVAGLTRALANECLRLEMQPVLAFAPTPLAALVAARARKPLVVMELAQLTGKLAPLPLAALRWPAETLARLSSMGVRTIGAALRLPRAGFAQRFGAAQLTMLDVLTGRAREVRAVFQLRERFRRRRELGCELTNRDWLLAALTPLLAELETFLIARDCGVMELECQLLHRQRRATRCLLQLAAPASDAAHLGALLAERLGTLNLPEPVRALEVRADTLFPRTPLTHSLWQAGEQGGGGTSAEAGVLLERLRARLGSGAVHGLCELQEHRPESAWGRTPPPPLAAAPTPAAAPGGAAGEAAVRRPLWLLKMPEPLAARAGMPRRRGGALHLVSELERIESGWWDAGEIERDYYTALDIHGVRLWVYRERHAPHGWFLHGVFG